jgi:hypothetical protein
MSTASELLIEQPVNMGEGAISQGSPSQPQAGLKGPEAPGGDILYDLDNQAARTLSEEAFA